MGILEGKTVQVIVELANIFLTPEKPDYPGGKWYVEGLFLSQRFFVPDHR